MSQTRRQFLKATSIATGAFLLPSSGCVGQKPAATQEDTEKADFTVQIQASPVEIARDRIVSTVTYNGQFPGPLLRFKESHQVSRVV